MTIRPLTGGPALLIPSAALGCVFAGIPHPDPSFQYCRSVICASSPVILSCAATSSDYGVPTALGRSSSSITYIGCHLPHRSLFTSTFQEAMRRFRVDKDTLSSGQAFALVSGLMS